MIKKPHSHTSSSKITSLPRIRRRGWHNYRLRLALRLGAGALCVGLTAWGLTVLLSGPAESGMVKAVRLQYAGQDLGLLRDREQAQEALALVERQFEQQFNMVLALDGQLQIQDVLTEPSSLGTVEGAARGLGRHVDQKVEAAVILIDNIPVTAVPTYQDAQWVLEAILQPYREAAASGADMQDIGFFESVTTLQDRVPVSSVDTPAQALAKLTLGEAVPQEYTVKRGDTLWAIAQNNGLRLSELRQANPALGDSDFIDIGQTLLLCRPQNLVNIIYERTVTQTQALPFDTVSQTDDNLYTTQKRTITPGRDGSREVVARVTYINGMELSREIVSETVLAEAVDEVVARGTKPVPASQQIAAAGTFLRPAEGVVSSRFGTRWGRLHAGLDIAADTGTPIYASKSGVVSFAGTNGGYGKLVKIDHGGGVETRYGHCSKLLVTPGQEVRQGELIALVGNTGNSTGPHVHFEIRIDGEPIDPETKL